MPFFHGQFNLPGVAQQLNPFIRSQLNFAALNFGNELFEISLTALLDFGRKGKRARTGERQKGNQNEKSAWEQQEEEISPGHKINLLASIEFPRTCKPIQAVARFFSKQTLSGSPI